ncbi:unnamed protein product [Prorocentrum cordatum]|uniref:Uncharacterized protein n=1 Tax=Prorocentrum cordatum TaxID=2364126 RepID=A0ABN9SA26_9DINO|nr:unnamed protein product [Polarella glacialis]
MFAFAHPSWSWVTAGPPTRSALGAGKVAAVLGCLPVMKRSMRVFRLELVGTRIALLGQGRSDRDESTSQCQHPITLPPTSQVPSRRPGRDQHPMLLRRGDLGSRASRERTGGASLPLWRWCGGRAAGNWRLGLGRWTLLETDSHRAGVEVQLVSS